MDVFLKAAIDGRTDFSLQLVHRVASTSAAKSNLVLSPLLVHSALGLLAAGSEGDTVDNLVSVLRAPSVDDLNKLSSNHACFILEDGSWGGGPRICFSNGFWLDASLPREPTFQAFASFFYNAKSMTIDFKSNADEAIYKVNSWVENATNGLIEELLPARSVDHNTRLVLGNAIYFKGIWEEKFDPSETKESDFYLLDGRSVQVPFMTSKNNHFLSKYDGFKVLRLPYKKCKDDRHFSMYIFLPDSQNGFWNLHEKLSSGSGFLDDHCPHEKVKVNLKLPKFKISFGFEASQVFEDIGLTLPFAADGNLTGIVESPEGDGLRVSAFFHKSVLEVSEDGTEAAVATATALDAGQGFLDPDHVDFEADHPFVFVIKEDLDRVVLFVGHLLDPLTA